MPKKRKKTELITAMVECPQGYGQKFDFDPQTQAGKRFSANGDQAHADNAGEASCRS